MDFVFFLNFSHLSKVNVHVFIANGNVPEYNCAQKSLTFGYSLFHIRLYPVHVFHHLGWYNNIHRPSFFVHQ